MGVCTQSWHLWGVLFAAQELGYTRHSDCHSAQNFSKCVSGGRKGWECETVSFLECNRTSEAFLLSQWSLPPKNKTWGAIEVVSHLRGMLRRWPKLYETDQAFIDVFFGGGLECCDIFLLPFSLTPSLAVGKGRVLPVNPNERSFKGPLRQFDLVPGTHHPQAWAVARSAWSWQSKERVHLLGSEQDGRAKVIAFHGSDVFLTRESQSVHEASLVKRLPRGIHLWSPEAEGVVNGQPENRHWTVTRGHSWVLWGTCQCAHKKKSQPQTFPQPKGHWHQFISVPFPSKPYPQA